MMRARVSLAVAGILGLAACTETKGTDPGSGDDRSLAARPASASANGTPRPAATPSAAPSPALELRGGDQSAPRSAPPPIPRQKATPKDLAKLNTWAQENGVASNVAAFVTLGLPVDADVKVTLSIQYNRREAPDSATATLVQEELLDDSLEGQRTTLRFARKDCATPADCPGGVAPWTLFDVSREQRCKPGRGHETYSGEPCN